MERPMESDRIREIEKILSTIWMEVLEKPDIDRSVSFLDLGGDSLNAMSCISRIHKVFGVEFTLDEFFLDDATILQFALIIDQVQSLSAGQRNRTV